MARRGQSQVAQLRLGLGNFSIYEGVNTIGRNRDATVNIKNMNISQHHAIIVVHEGEHYISDLNSSNHCFCEGTKMEPYKLYKLRNRIEITLGGLSGIYVTNAAFFEGNKPSHSTTLASQSFYGSNTQPLDNFVEDIHEVPTQEISWTNLKSTSRNNNDKSASKATTEVSNNAASEATRETVGNTEQNRMSVFEEQTQVFDIRKSMRNKSRNSDTNETLNKINKNDMTDCKETSSSNQDNFDITQEEVQVDDKRVDAEEDKDQSTSNCEKLDNVKAKEKDIPDQITVCENDQASIDNCEKLDNAKTTEDKVRSDDELTDCDEDKEQAITSTSGCNQKLVNVETVEEKITDAQDDELTDCEEDVLPSNNGQIVDEIRDKSAQDDDEMTDCEEEALTSNHQRPTEKVKSNDDDEMTDCEEEALTSNHQKPAVKVKSNDDDEMTDCEEEALTKSHQKPLQKPEIKINSDDDEMTDCEENNELTSATNKKRETTSQANKVAVCEEAPGIDSDDNNDSMDFFKVEKFNSSDDSSVFLGFETPLNPSASNQNTDKSVVVQDNQKTDKTVSDNEDSDDESVAKFASNKKKKSLMVLSTQDFDDSYLENQTKKSTINMDADEEIPATQYQMLDTTTDGSKKATRTSSRKSFKLDASEYMADYSEALHQTTIEACKNDSVQDMFNSSTEASGAPGNKTNLKEFSEIVTPEIEPCGSKDVTLDDEDFLGPTQQVGISFTRKATESKNTNLDDTDCFLGPTQKVEIPSTRKSKVQLSESRNTNLDDTDFFAAPTQKIVASQSNTSKKHDLTADGDFYDCPTQKVTGEEDSFLAPTQKLSSKSSNRKTLFPAEDTEEIYEAATQKMPLIEEFQKSTPHRTKKEEHVFGDPQEEIYDVPTQKVNLKSSKQDPLGIFSVPNEHGTSTEDEGIVDDDVFIEPVQKSNSMKCNKDKFDASMDIFDVGTQIVSQEQEKVENIDDDDTFSAPTQLTSSDHGSNDIKDEHEETALNNDKSMKSGDKSPQKVDKKKTFSFKKSHLDATISDLAETKTNEKANKVEDTKLEKLTIKKTKDNKIEKLTKNQKVSGIKEPQEIKETKSKKRANKKATKLENVVDDEIELTIKKSTEPDTFEENKIVKSSKKSDVEKLTIKTSKEAAIIEEAKLEKLTIKKNKKIDNVENNKVEESTARRDEKADNAELNKTERLVIKRPKEPEIKIEKLTIKNNKKVDNIEDNKLEKLTIKKNISTKNTHKFLNSDEDLIPKFLTESSSNIINKESTSFNVSNSEQNKSLALLESKFNKTKKAANSCEEIKIIVPKNRKSKSIATDEEVQLETTKRASKRTSKKPQEVPVKKTAKNDKEEKVSGRKTRTTKKIVEMQSESENSEKITSASTSSLARISEENCADTKGKTKRGKNRTVEEANNNINDENAEQNRAGPSKSTKSKKRQFTDEDDSAVVVSVSSPTKKQKLQLVPESPGAALKGLRKQKPKVVFTMMESPKLESFIKQLGGSIVDSVEFCTVLITESVKRTQKLLTAIGLGKPICSPNWIIDSKKKQEFLDPWDYILTDQEAEKKWSFSLKQSLTQSRDLQLLRSYNFFIQVTNGVDVIKGAIESCGGKILPKIPSAPSEGTFIISCPENRSKYSRILKKNPDFKIIEAEAVFDGVLRQELRFERHLLK